MDAKSPGEYDAAGVKENASNVFSEIGKIEMLSIVKSATPLFHKVTENEVTFELLLEMTESPDTGKLPKSFGRRIRRIIFEVLAPPSHAIILVIILDVTVS
jgi:hypothetical protein